jgi:hypothetical protein
VTVAAGGRRYLSALAGLLLIVCAALVIAGVSIERGGETGTHSGETAEHVETDHPEETPGAHEDQLPAAPAPSGHAESEESGVVGALESPAALAALAVFSVGLAALIWWRPTRAVAAAVAVVAAIAGALDLTELVRHVSADRGGLAALAGLILVLRMATVAIAVMLWRRAGERAAATG